MLGRRRIISTFLCAAALLVAACGDGDDPAMTTAGGSQLEESGTEPADPDAAGFCDAITQISSGEVLDPEALGALVETVRQTAPADIRSDAVEFARLSEIVFTAFAQAGAPEREVDAAAVVGSLPPDAQGFVEDLMASAESGEAQDNVAGRVATYTVTNCT